MLPNWEKDILNISNSEHLQQFHREYDLFQDMSKDTALILWENLLFGRG